ncbi:hypothetical protein F0562_009786 [Nyssa sinensis]|uniref:EF-hand domain-containing protein n=1 Tax=Nyssa sinensis TaxID=561372 RepID=A0A5J4ZWW5_9ASTE|nr:hypothetical protein F0562_009786 [Nyssa sinensis]
MALEEQCYLSSLNDLRRNNQQDLVEVTLELEDDSIVVCSVTPTSNANTAGDEEPAGFLARSLSATSKIRRKFSWLRSSSSRTSSDVEVPAISARDARKLKAQLARTRSNARQALNGLRADRNEDGRITRDEVQELLMLSASANKLSKLKEQSDEYASLIMEELDPENLGYIEMHLCVNYFAEQRQLHDLS